MLDWAKPTFVLLATFYMQKTGHDEIRHICDWKSQELLSVKTLWDRPPTRIPQAAAAAAMSLTQPAGVTKEPAAGPQ